MRGRALLMLAVLAGCSRSQKNQDFVPPEESARAALDAALRTWMNGNTAKEVPDTNPVVMVIDERRTPVRPLLGYTILGPVPAEAPICFAVQLKLGNPAEELRERYVVVGIDPLWVWRYDDYVMITHWAHPMTADKKTESPRR